MERTMATCIIDIMHEQAATQAGRDDACGDDTNVGVSIRLPQLASFSGPLVLFSITLVGVGLRFSPAALSTFPSIQFCIPSAVGLPCRRSHF